MSVEMRLLQLQVIIIQTARPTQLTWPIHNKAEAYTCWHTWKLYMNDYIILHAYLEYYYLGTAAVSLSMTSVFALMIGTQWALMFSRRFSIEAPPNVSINSCLNFVSQLLGYYTNGSDPANLWRPEFSVKCEVKPLSRHGNGHTQHVGFSSVLMFPNTMGIATLPHLFWIDS